MQLKKSALSSITQAEVPQSGFASLPEKVIQFGTGVLLRGLPDFFIDKANKQGVFNGRILVVKSTGPNVDDFTSQDNLYTQRVCGIEDGKTVSMNIVNGSISRVLSAQTHWEDILLAATGPELQIVISNTTEVGIALVEENILHTMPVSYPGKLLAFLYRRFIFFKGKAGSGLVIIPTELLPNNGRLLKEILVKLCAFNGLENEFADWLQSENIFCDSLVDRIVPGKIAEKDRIAIDRELGYHDDLLFVSEPYRLWAIQASDPRVEQILSFAQADPGVVITPDIFRFRELKLRLLNGTHTFSSGFAFLQGFDTVGQAMNGGFFESYIRPLIYDEIIPSILGESISEEQASAFAGMVLDRFRNPFIEHKWISITLQYSSKMAMRNVPLLVAYVERFNKIPEKMSEGFAAHILFMRGRPGAEGKYYGNRKNQPYLIQDDKAAIYVNAWESGILSSVVPQILGDSSLWGRDLNTITGFAGQVETALRHLISTYETVS